jgi:hypothetical protein
MRLCCRRPVGPIWLSMTFGKRRTRAPS